MLDVILGLALFFAVICAVSVIQRRSAEHEEAEFLAEQERQQKKWVEDYKPNDDDVLPRAKPQAN